MKRVILGTLLSAVLLLATSEASAQNMVGLNLGYSLDAGEVFVGAQARFDLDPFPLLVNPSLETYFIDGGTWLRFDLNGLLPFNVENTVYTPYAGAGVGLNYYNPESGDSDTDPLLNFIFGANFGFSAIQPFAEARIDVGSGLGASLKGGILVRI